jgi:hypothetical protein
MDVLVNVPAAEQCSTVKNVSTKVNLIILKIGKVGVYTMM